MESLCGGWSAPISCFKSSAARAPSVGCWPATVESVWDTGQADRSISICPQPHASSPQQGLCGSAVSIDRRTFKCIFIIFFLQLLFTVSVFHWRSWRTDLPKGACSLVSASIEHEDCPPVGGVRAIVLESNYLLEPCGSGKSRLTHICRVDLK